MIKFIKIKVGVIILLQSLKGKVAIITGASRGIGREIAKTLAKNKINLVLCGRDEKKLKDLQLEIKKFGVLSEICIGDISDESVIVKTIEKTSKAFGGIDILINNAGIAIPKPIIQSTSDDFDMHININVKAPFLLCKYAIPHLKKSDCPTIINLSSVVGYKGYINQGIYTTSKHALVGFTKVLAQELHQFGIRVHIVAPGGVDTEMVSATRPDINKSELMSPQEIADIVEFLLIHRGNAVIDEINIRRATNSPWK